MSSIINQITDDYQTKSNLSAFFKRFEVYSHLKKASVSKCKGYPVTTLFYILFSLVFFQKPLLTLLAEAKDSKQKTIHKDTFYRFLNNPYFDWQKFLLLLASSVVKFYKSLTAESRVCACIFDDSSYKRDSSKKVELLAKCFDHVENCYYKGFRKLTAGWSDGTSFVPLLFSLLSSNKDGNSYDQGPEIPASSAGAYRRKEAKMKATELLPQMLDSILKYLSGTFQYVLCDSWFTWPNVVKSVVQRNLHYIGMLKDNNNALFEYEGRWYRLSTLYAAAKPQTISTLNEAVIFSIIVNYAGVPAKIVFVRNRKCQKGKKAKREWLAILSTDLNIADAEIIRIYGIRWDIEVYFKLCKSYLKLGKEIQTACYDGMVAHTTIVCVRYIMLSVQSRDNKDGRSCGGMFYMCCNEIADISFTQAFSLLIDLLTTILREELFLSENQISMLLDKLLNQIPSIIKQRLRIPLATTVQASF